MSNSASGLASAIFSIVFALVYLSRPTLLNYSSEDQNRILILGVAAPLIAVMVGVMRDEIQKLIDIGKERTAQMVALRGALDVINQGAVLLDNQMRSQFINRALRRVWNLPDEVADKKPPFKAERPMRKLEGDLDVFGDGSVIILSTPGHTPGHQSLLVHLANTGWVILTGDAVHFKDNWDNKRVPSMNTSAEQTKASLKKLEDLMVQKKAQLWINHDKPQSQSQKRSPQFYD